jgi:hypothetical protein
LCYLIIFFLFYIEGIVMNSTLVETLYAAAVPPWLTALVDAGQLQLRDLENFTRLSSILSERDVSFYYLYAKRLSPLTDNVYEGLRNITTLPDNIQWVQDHAELIKECEDTVDLTNVIATATGEIPEPHDIRRAFYEPRAFSNTTLFLLGRTQSIYVTYIDYFSAAMSQISSMVGYDQAVHSRVLNAFIVANQKQNAV